MTLSAQILITITILVISFAMRGVFADDGNIHNFAINLGWISIGSGLLGNIPFLLHKRVKKYAVAKLGGGHEVTRELAMEHNPIMILHLALNSTGFVTGMIHGLLFVSRLDVVSLSLAIMMTALMISGFILRFSMRLNLKFATRIFHGQAILSGILVILVILHVMFTYGDD